MYVFKKKSLRVLAYICDAIGGAIYVPVRFFCRGTLQCAPTSAQPKNILVVRLDHIGDVVFATVALRSLRENFPGAKITLLTGSWAKDAARGNPNVDEIMVYDAPWFGEGGSRTALAPTVNGGFWQTLKELRKRKFDLGIDLRGDARHIVMMRLAGIKRRMSYGITGLGFLLTDEIPYVKGKHEIEHNLDLVRAACGNGKQFDMAGYKPEVFINDADKFGVEEFLRKEVGAIHELPLHLIGVHPTAGAQSKMWQPNKFAKLMDLLTAEFGAEVIAVGREDAMTREVLTKTTASRINAVGKTTLGELAALIKRCDLFISTDSGPAHIAAALGVPVVVVWSGTNEPSQWAPAGKEVAIVRKDMACSPCEKKSCESPACTDSISVEDVMDAVRKLWKERKLCASV